MTKQFLVLGEYTVTVAMAASQGLCGQISHINGTGITPVGHFLAYCEDASELRPAHWSVQLFIRMGLRYNESARTTDVVTDSLNPKWPGWHPDLPGEIGRLLIREQYCAEPMAVDVNRFQERGGVQFGQTWLEDADDT